MRTAVALPTLAPEAPLRECLDRVIEALADCGLEVEAFAEMERVREGSEVPLFHYLRFDERHRAAPFQVALWPLGRDARVWEPAWILSRRFPGTVWMLDGPVHHAALGGMAISGHWGLYGRLVEKVFDDPAPVFSLFAAGWASRAAYRAHDPMRRRLGCQQQVVPAMRCARGGPPWERDITSEETVPLPAVPGAADERLDDPGGDPRVAIVSMDVIRPRELMAALEGVLTGRSSLDLSIAIPEPTYHARGAPAAHAAGVADRIRWLLSPSSSELLREVRRASIAVFLEVDVSADDRALLECGLRLGRASIAVDIPPLADVPDPPLLKLRPGAALGPGLALALNELLDDRRLRDALGRAGKRWVAARPGAGEIARRLERRLRRGPDPERVVGTGRVWTSLREAMLRDCLPTTGPGSSRERVGKLLDGVLPERHRHADPA